MSKLLKVVMIVLLLNQLVFASTIANQPFEISVANYNSNRSSVQSFLQSIKNKNKAFNSDVEIFWKDKKSTTLPEIKYENNKFIIENENSKTIVELLDFRPDGFYYTINSDKHFYDLRKSLKDNINLINSSAKSSYNLMNLLITNAQASVVVILGVLVGVGVVLTFVVRNMMLDSKESLKATLEMKKVEEQVKIVKEECNNNIKVEDLSKSIDNLKAIVNYYNKSTDDFMKLCDNLNQKYKHVSDNTMKNIQRVCNNYSNAKLCIRNKINASAINNSNSSKEKIIYQKSEDKYSISK